MRLIFTQLAILVAVLGCVAVLLIPRQIGNTGSKYIPYPTAEEERIIRQQLDFCSASLVWDGTGTPSIAWRNASNLAFTLSCEGTVKTSKGNQIDCDQLWSVEPNSAGKTALEFQGKTSGVGIPTSATFHCSVTKAFGSINHASLGKGKGVSFPNLAFGHQLVWLPSNNH